MKINLFSKHKIEKIEIQNKNLENTQNIIKNEIIELETSKWIKITNNKGVIVKKFIIGKLDIKKFGRYWRIYLTIPLKDYIIDVLLAELGNRLIQKEALKAFYLVVKSYTKYHLKSARHKDFDFCDIAHCQLYNGLSPIRNDVKKIIKNIENLDIVYQNKTILAVFNSSCSLFSASAKEIWGEEIPYLKSQKNQIYETCFSHKKTDNLNKNIIENNKISNLNDFNLKNTICDLNGRNRNFKWFFKISKTDFRRLFKDDLIKFELNDNGYPKNILIGTKNYSAENFRRKIASAYGWGVLKSNLFEILVDGDFYIFIGGGFGHGVGFCIIEAEIMGEMGFNYKKIINHFYYNVEIKKVINN
ncbi:SpoIID/LytB domain-containing protein [bacterium]|nr:SpoIID/LytB domain-containing protein [bacterium]